MSEMERNVMTISIESLLAARLFLSPQLLGNRLFFLSNLGQGAWGSYVDGVNADHTRVIMKDGYSVGDNALYQWQAGWPERKLLYGVPLEQRAAGQDVPLNSINHIFFTPDDMGLLFITSLFVDSYGLGYLDLADPAALQPVEIMGIQHSGLGELVALSHLCDARYAVEYNIDGCSWLYEGIFEEASLTVKLEHVLCGRGKLTNGMLEAFSYEKETDRFALSFSTATSPSQM